MHISSTHKINESGQLTTATSIQKNETAKSFFIEDNRPASIMQIKALPNSLNKSIQKKANSTGLPDNLKSGIENLSGHAMDDVKVHYNSDKPAQLNAHAYAQGSEIHLASGQEKHLPHEAWHVVQQKQGRVKPTMQMKGKVNVNDDAGLEKEADIMGAKALQTMSKDNVKQRFVDNRSKMILQKKPTAAAVIQRGKNENDSDIEIDSDLEDTTIAENNALSKSYKNGKIPKKRSKQVERVLKLRKVLKQKTKKSKKKGGKLAINATDFQAILAQLNLEYSPENTTAIGIGEEGNTIVTKMGGVNANYLGKILKSKVIVEKRKSAKNTNTNHAEKALSKLERKKKYRRLIIDKKRCEVCEKDKHITESANEIRD